jgi:hypothetical protein
LTLADDKFALEVLLAYLRGFFYRPLFDSDFLYAAEIVDLHVMRIAGRLIGCGRQEPAREIGTIAADIYAFGFDAIERCAALGQMKMFGILRAAAPAGDLIFGNSHLS